MAFLLSYAEILVNLLIPGKCSDIKDNSTCGKNSKCRFNPIKNKCLDKSNVEFCNKRYPRGVYSIGGVRYMGEFWSKPYKKHIYLIGEAHNNENCDESTTIFALPIEDFIYNIFCNYDDVDIFFEGDIFFEEEYLDKYNVQRRSEKFDLHIHYLQDRILDSKETHCAETNSDIHFVDIRNLISIINKEINTLKDIVFSYDYEGPEFYNSETFLSAIKELKSAKYFNFAEYYYNMVRKIIWEYLGDKLNELANIYSAEYSRDEAMELIKTVDKIMKDVFNSYFSKRELMNLNDDNEKKIRIGKVSTLLMDYYTLYRLMLSTKKNIVIYCGDAHRQLYKDFLVRCGFLQIYENYNNDSVCLDITGFYNPYFTDPITQARHGNGSLRINKDPIPSQPNKRQRRHTFKPIR